MARVPHWEAVVLAIRRGDMVPVTRYLRKCGGKMHPRVIKEIVEAKWEVLHPTLVGGHFKRCNFLTEPLWEDAKALIVKNSEIGMPQVTNFLANLLEGVAGPTGATRIRLKTRGGPKFGNHAVDWLDETRIALYLAQYVHEDGKLRKQTEIDAILRFGVSRATIRRIWKKRHDSALYQREIYLRLRQKRFRKTIQTIKRVQPYPSFED